MEYQITERSEPIDKLSLTELESLRKYINARQLELAAASATGDAMDEGEHRQKRKPESEDDFIPVKHPKARVSHSTLPLKEPNVPLNNRYQPLEEANDDATPVILTSDNDNLSDSTTNTSTNHSHKQTRKPSNNKPPVDPNSNSTPIVIRDKSQWPKISSLLYSKKINYTRASSAKDGIRVQPSTIEDFKNMHKLLIAEHFPFHTHQLRSEKKLKIVIRGIPTEFTTSDIAADLHKSGYPALKVTRMLNKDDHPMQMVAIEIDTIYKSIYKLPKILGLDVQLEPLRSKGNLIQCHRCQLYGHVQVNCYAEYKCMKCAENHSTHTCTKVTTTPAKCSNCGGPHPSTYRGCKSRPNIVAKPVKAWNNINNNCSNNSDNNSNSQNASTSMPNNTHTHTHTTPNLKQIQQEQLAAKATPTQSKPEPKLKSKLESIALELSFMFIDFHSLNPNREQLLSFNERIGNILKLSR